MQVGLWYRTTLGTYPMSRVGSEYAFACGGDNTNVLLKHECNSSGTHISRTLSPVLRSARSNATCVSQSAARDLPEWILGTNDVTLPPWCSSMGCEHLCAVPINSRVTALATETVAVHLQSERYVCALELRAFGQR